MDDETDSSQFIVETYEEDSKMINNLNAICKAIRGVAQQIVKLLFYIEAVLSHKAQ